MLIIIAMLKWFCAPMLTVRCGLGVTCRAGVLQMFSFKPLLFAGGLTIGHKCDVSRDMCHTLVTQRIGPLFSGSKTLSVRATRHPAGEGRPARHHRGRLPGGQFVVMSFIIITDKEIQRSGSALKPISGVKTPCIPKCREQGVFPRAKR